jgi:curved DNA-binding protein CbpA
MFIRIQEAYDTLRDKLRRKDYDLSCKRHHRVTIVYQQWNITLWDEVSINDMALSGINIIFNSKGKITYTRADAVDCIKQAQIIPEII